MGPQSSDQKLELGTGIYVTNETRLYEVFEVNSSAVHMRNVITETTFWMPRNEIEQWRIVLPLCPDNVDSLI